eukprot:16447465-Heterocapsa_arctica.AAC.1
MLPNTAYSSRRGTRHATVALAERPAKPGAACLRPTQPCQCQKMGRRNQGRTQQTIFNRVGPEEPRQTAQSNSRPSKRVLQVMAAWWHRRSALRRLRLYLQSTGVCVRTVIAAQDQSQAACRRGEGAHASALRRPRLHPQSTSVCVRSVAFAGQARLGTTVVQTQATWG